MNMKSYWAYDGKGSGQMHERGTPCADWPACKEYVLKSDALENAEERVRERAVECQKLYAVTKAEAVSREREEIVEWFHRWWIAENWDPDCWKKVEEALRSRGKQEPLSEIHTDGLGRQHVMYNIPQPPKIERLDCWSDWVASDVVNKVNELVDAVNEGRGK